MNYETMLSILEDALCDRHSRDGQTLINVLIDNDYSFTFIEDSIRQIIHPDGHSPLYESHHTAEDFWHSLNLRMQEKIKAAFSVTGIRGRKVVVGKALLLPFPDKQLPPAPAP